MSEKEVIRLLRLQDLYKINHNINFNESADMIKVKFRVLKHLIQVESEQLIAKQIKNAKNHLKKTNKYFYNKYLGKQ